MRSYIYDSVKLSDGKRLVTRYTLEDAIFLNIIKFLFFLFILWPLEILIWWPIKLIFKGILIIIEFTLRGIWWLVKLPFCLLFSHKTPNF